MSILCFAKSRTDRCSMAIHSDDNALLAVSAIQTLSSIAKTPNGAESLVAARTLDVVWDTIDSQSTEVRKSTCEMLAALARHRDTLLAVIDAIPCSRFLSVLRYGHRHIAWTHSHEPAFQ